MHFSTFIRRKIILSSQYMKKIITWLNLTLIHGETMSKWGREGSFLTWEKISKKVSKENVVGHCENFNTPWNGKQDT